MSGFNKIIKLVEKTNEKFVILDKNGDPSCVIMPISEYESLVYGDPDEKGLTEGENLDTINGDIEDIREDQESEIGTEEADQFDQKSSFGAKYFNPTNSEKKNDDENSDEDDDRYYFEPVE
jgi:prevent-host-death family protein